jgi:hypothetical protein
MILEENRVQDFQQALLLGLATRAGSTRPPETVDGIAVDQPRSVDGK